MAPCRNAESALCNPALLTRVAAATSEFNIALRELVGPGTPGERERLRMAATALMRVLARVLLQTE